MATTVNNAFSEFRRDYVDIDEEKAGKARTSRDYLIDQIKGLKEKDSGFPPVSGQYVGFGSFSRNTKIRPLDDIDLLVLVSGANSTFGLLSGYSYRITANDSTCLLWAFRHDNGGNDINSIKVLNKLKTGLVGVANYSKAELHRNQEAVTLNLKSYDWVFDIVPAVPANDGQGGIAFYLIPDGSGNWKRTDPRMDSKAATEANQSHNGHLLPLIRLLKFWNKRTVKPVLGSYYFENLVLKAYSSRSALIGFKGGIKPFFESAASSIWLPMPDPKGLGPNLDAGVDYDTKKKVSEAMTEASTHVGYALMYENQGDHENAIYWWGRVFGPSFPAYSK